MPRSSTAWRAAFSRLTQLAQPGPSTLMIMALSFRGYGSSGSKCRERSSSAPHRGRRRGCHQASGWPFGWVLAHGLLGSVSARLAVGLLLGLEPGESFLGCGVDGGHLHQPCDCLLYTS